MAQKVLTRAKCDLCPKIDEREYGDDAPPPLLPAPAELATTATTPFVTLGAERIRDEDADGDGLPAARDNCPFVSNRDQTDSDRDGVGDVCDNAPGVTNAPQNDRDQDGVGDSHGFSRQNRFYCFMDKSAFFG